ncbi:hypothetical protein HM1_2371 [Heliomicrobium modesticaldum Ice1]|uniref:Uncharacterized protein n=1 Tax=Heliobacterium modesticaldum (strain ATCC 51547 / Ice1) TaxID=498761 RepID=B0TII0_HELMI|nr:hypothetical protein [Heliomicrobium modesticaldum]ABZ84921.1 hypothetical protein HM1_2371 [Heliomicrobium modesticaldum Ice1]
MKGIKPLWVAVFAAVALALLWGVESAYSRFGVEQPLKQAIAAVAPGAVVENHSEDTGKKVVEISPVLVSDLGEAHRQLSKIVRQHLGPQAQVRLTDNPDEVSRKLWEQLQFPLFQGIDTGNYTEMKKQVDAIGAGAVPAQADISIDDENVYLRIVNGDHYLYRIVPREKGGDRR